MCITIARAAAAGEQLLSGSVLHIARIYTSVGNAILEYDYEVFTFFYICLGPT